MATASQDHLAGRAYLRLVFLGALIGPPAALLAAAFLAVVHEVQHWLWEALPSALGVSSPPWYLVIGLPVAGACVVLAARTLLPGDGGHSPLEGIGGGATPIAHGPGVALAAVATLSFGLVLGPEAPLIALGSIVGLAVTSFVRLDAREKRVLATTGSFSAISALFGGPIVAGILMVEGGIGVGAALIPMLVPGFVAAAIGYLIFVGLGSWGHLDAQGLTVPTLPVYQGTHVLDLFVGLAVGVAAAVIVTLVRRAATGMAAQGRRRVGMPGLLLGGAAGVGLLAQLAAWLGANPQDVLFSGQASVPAVVQANSATIVLVVLVAKALAYALSLGCGFRGGPVFPAIFLGIALATFAIVWFGVSPTLAVAVGAAAGAAATTRLLITSALFAALLVGTAGLDAVPAAVLAAVAAWLTMAMLDRRTDQAETSAQR